MYEDYKVIPDQYGMKSRYESARAFPKATAWMGVVVCGVLFLVSLAFAPTIIVVMLALLVWSIWKALNPTEQAPLLCPLCNQGTVAVRRAGPRLGQRTVMFACSKCRVAVDSGLVESGRPDRKAGKEVVFGTAVRADPPLLPTVKMSEPPLLNPPQLPLPPSGSNAPSRSEPPLLS